MKENEILDEVKGALVIWNEMAIKLRRILITLGSTAILSSLAITAFLGSPWLCETAIRVLSFLSTLSLTALTAFGISSKGNNSRNAWRHLNYSLLLYYAEKISLEQLVKAKKEGEDMLGGVDFEASSLKQSSKSQS